MRHTSHKQARALDCARDDNHEGLWLPLSGAWSIGLQKQKRLFVSFARQLKLFFPQLFHPSVQIAESLGQFA